MTTTRTAIDLFSGCGGLSLGAEHAGFEVRLAVEKSPMAAETHYRNFHKRHLPRWDDDAQTSWEQHLSLSEDGANPDLLAQAKEGLVVGDMRKVVEDEAVLEHFRGVDLVAGGPPCQGFSMAGRRLEADERNELPWKFLQFVAGVGPKAVVVENVVGISRAFQKNGARAKPVFDQLADELADQGPGYVVQRVEVNAKHFDVAQSRPRMMLVALRRDMASALGVVTTEGVWATSSEHDRGADESYGHALRLVPPLGGPYLGDERGPGRGLVAAESVLRDLDDHGYAFDEDAPYYDLHPLARWLRTARPPTVEEARPLANQKLRNHGARVTARFALYHYLRDIGVDPGQVLPVGRVVEDEVEAREIVRQVFRRTEGATLEIDRDAPYFESGDEDISYPIVRLATKKHTQRAIVADQPSPTVVTLPDDHVHPHEARIMTVREMARLQSFPDWFEFRSKETTGGTKRRQEVPQYSQVGNAVPPVMAWAVLDHVRWLLDQYDALPEDVRGE